MCATEAYNKRVFFLTRAKLFRFQMAIAANADSAILKDMKVIPIKTQEKFKAMVHHFNQFQEYLFVADEQNVHSIDLKSGEVINLLTLDYRETTITDMVGRFSKTNGKMMLFISDMKGKLRVFDPDLYLITNEVQLFAPEERVLEIS